tara:strand:+ start:1558 stop:2001 length:444 start_codon:yes stop_codon:yes gene_type:complete
MSGKSTGIDDVTDIKWRAIEAFNHLGANARDKFAWSAQSDDRSITVLTLWCDEIDDDGVNVEVDHFGSPTLDEWTHSRRNKARIRHLKDVWASEDRTFRVVMVKVADGKEKVVPRRAVARWPDERLTMTLTYFCENTGELRATGKRT